MSDDGIATNAGKTALAIAVCVAMVIPGLIVGGIVTAIYRLMLSGILQTSFLPDFMIRVGLQWFPSLLHGGVAGAVALYLTTRVIKGAEIKIVAYATAAAWIAVMVFASSILIAVGGMLPDPIAGIAQVVGLALGLGATVQDLENGR